MVFGALRRFGVAELRRVLPAVERRFIASPRFGQGIVAGQINTLEVTSGASLDVLIVSRQAM
jgi:hypothetical protein